MTNLRDTPNRLQFHRDSTFTAHFGPLATVLPMQHVRGEGHSKRVEVHFNGLSLELTTADAIGLAGRLAKELLGTQVWSPGDAQELALRAAQFDAIDCSGSLADIGGE